MTRAAWVFDVTSTRSRPRVHATSRASCGPTPGSRSSAGAAAAAPCSSCPATSSGSTCWCRATTRCGTTTSAGPATGSARCGSSALAAIGVVGTEVHGGGLICTPWCSLVCFAGLGPGEVTLGGAKLVGISQRRTRAGARFQCAVHRRWDPVAVVDALAEPRPSPDELRDLVRGVDVPLTALEAASCEPSTRSRRPARSYQRPGAGVSWSRRFDRWHGSWCAVGA